MRPPPPTTARRLDRDERGSVGTVEALLIVPVLIAAVGLIFAGGRIAVAHQSVDAAANAAARAASLARTRTTAVATARSVATASLDRERLRCSTLNVDLDTAGFAVPVGTPARVTATLTCTVQLSDLGLPGLGQPTLTGRASSVLDTYRERR